MVGERRRLGRRRAVGSWLLRLALPAVLVAAIAGLLVASVAQINRSSGPYRRTVDRGYAALAAPLVAESNRSAASLQSLLSSLHSSSVRSFDRVTLFAQLDQLASDTTDVERSFGAIAPPEPATAAVAQCHTALADRVAGIGALRGALEGVLGGRTGLGPVDQAGAVSGLESAGTALAAGDTAWSACRRALRRAPGAARLAASQWVRDPSVFEPTAAARLVSGVASSRSLAAVHRLALVGLVTEPTSLSTGASQVVPPTLALTVHVVVADQGNVDEAGVEVGGVALQQGAAGSPVPVQRTLDLAADASTTLTLPAFPVTPGSSYVLQVTAESPRTTGTGPLASATLAVQIQPATTVTAVVASANPALLGRAVTYTAEVSASLSGLPKPTGSVAFDDDGVVIPGCASLSLEAGRATCTTTYAGSATHAITAVYSGNPQLASSNSGVYSERVGSG